MNASRYASLAVLAFALLSCKRGAAPKPAPDVAVVASTDHVKWIEVDTDVDGNIAKCAVYHDDPERIPLPVRELADRKFPAARSRFFETELYAELGLVFEVEVQTREGQHCELAARANGVELYTECRLEEGRIPERVSAAVAALLPEGEILEAETKQGPGIDETAVEVQLGEDRHYVRVARDGSVVQHLVRLRGALAEVARQ